MSLGTTESPPPTGEARFPIVGIGASAGGLHALEALIAQLAPGHIAFVVLQHLAPGHASALTEILKRSATIEVRTAEDDTRVAPGVLYVAPAGVDLSIEAGTLRLAPLGPSEGGARHSIDAFFRSLAEERGSMAIGVLLSGAGTDGTMGLEAIKEHGGITFVQEPSTADHPSMPESALDAGYADVALDAAEIGRELMRLGAHPYVVSPAAITLEEAPWRALLSLLRESFGVDFGLYKQSTLERRVQRRMALARIAQLADYLEQVRASPVERAALYGDLLIGVTSFFRDGAPFEALSSVAIPRLLEGRAPTEPVRAWVAGCATGEEAYSIAIALLEHTDAADPPRRVQLFATDVDERALARARRGEYPASIELDVSAERLARFFARTSHGYRVGQHLRDAVVFARHDVGADPPYSRMDLVSCRNVLIYMQPALQGRVLRAFHYALRPGGVLLLGTSESVGDGAELFSLLDRKQKLYTKKAVPTEVLDFGLHARAEEQERLRPRGATPPIEVLKLADRKVLERYGPPGVVVDERLQILQFRGRTGRYLEPTPGFATLNLLRLARPELLAELRPAIQRALAGDAPTVSAPVRVRVGDEHVSVRVDVSPLPDVGAGRGLLVLFAEEAASPEVAGTPALEDGVRVAELERELVATKEYLQATIEELETANEELQSANEELQSANEELQSSNEEHETAREELQSTNEELTTLNDELGSRMTQLRETDDDLQNVLGLVSTAVVLVDADLRIRHFSAAAGRLLDLLPDDLGRSVSHLRATLRARDLEATVGESIASLVPREQRVRGADGEVYRMRIAPYRSSDGAARGASIELAADSGDDLERTWVRRVAAAAAEALPDALAVLDATLSVVWGNRAFVARFGADVEVLGRPLEDLWDEAEPDLFAGLSDAARRDAGFVAGASSRRASKVTATPLRAPDSNRQLLLLRLDDARPGGREADA